MIHFNLMDSCMQLFAKRLCILPWAEVQMLLSSRPCAAEHIFRKSFYLFLHRDVIFQCSATSFDKDAIYKEHVQPVLEKAGCFSYILKEMIYLEHIAGNAQRRDTREQLRDLRKMWAANPDILAELNVWEREYHSLYQKALHEMFPVPYPSGQPIAL